jgi:EthD domain
MICNVARGPRAFQAPEWRSRMLVLLNANGTSECARGALRSLGPALSTRLPGVRIRYSVASGDDDLSRSLVEFRGYELLDAVAELTWPVDEPLPPAELLVEPVLEAVEGSARIRSLVAGQAAILLDDPAVHFMLMTGTRLAHKPIEEFRHWWLHQHAPLVERLCFPMETYGQLHADRALSERLCRRGNLDYKTVDAADSVYLADVEAFLAQTGIPEVAAELRNDEVQFCDVAAGGFGMIGTVLFDSRPPQLSAQG